MTRSQAGQGGRIRVGISGWTYPPWRGVFYPQGLRQKDELSFAARQVGSIEINGTFYRQQAPRSFTAWAAAVPEDFVFSIKAPRFITHIRRLAEIEGPLANFMACGLLNLGARLGPILWQFPPTFPLDRDRFAHFLDLLPKDTAAAAALAARHDAWLKEKAAAEIDANRPLRHAVEIRHESYRDQAFIDLLRAHGVALVCADTVEWPRLMDVTADFVYLRLHGSEALYASGYAAAALDAWARRVRAWAAGGEPADADRIGPPAARKRRDVFVYFDNDTKIRAPFDARALMQRLGQIRDADRLRRSGFDEADQHVLQAKGQNLHADGEQQQGDDALDHARPGVTEDEADAVRIGEEQADDGGDGRGRHRNAEQIGRVERPVRAGGAEGDGDRDGARTDHQRQGHREEGDVGGRRRRTGRLTRPIARGGGAEEQLPARGDDD